MEKHVVTAENALKIWEWLRTRGGIYIWGSVDWSLSRAGQTYTTPARTAEGEAYTKPHWSCTSEPIRHITDPSEVTVSVDREVKRFRVGVRMGSQGMSLKVTDGGSRKIRSAVEKAGEGAYHVFDYMSQEAVIMAPHFQQPLPQYITSLNRE